MVGYLRCRGRSDWSFGLKANIHCSDQSCTFPIRVYRLSLCCESFTLRRAQCRKSARCVLREPEAGDRLWRPGGCGNGVMVWLLRHRQTKGTVTARLDLRPPRHISTLPTAVYYPAVPQNEPGSLLPRNWSERLRPIAVNDAVRSRGSYLESTGRRPLLTILDFFDHGVG